MSKHPYIGSLGIGDTVQTEKDGKKISVTIKNISIDPTWSDVGILIYIDHTVDGLTQESCVGIINFTSWFDGEITWEKVKK